MGVSQASYIGAINALLAAEREKCKRDVCMYCAGHCPPYERQAVGPNGAGNYVHNLKRTAPHATGQPERLSSLCVATSIFARERFEKAEATR